MSAALYIGVIAQLTGWSESHIRWHLPLSRGWACFHTARLLAGERRVWARPTREDRDWERRAEKFMDRFRPVANGPDQATASK